MWLVFEISVPMILLNNNLALHKSYSIGTKMLNGMCSLRSMFENKADVPNFLTLFNIKSLYVSQNIKPCRVALDLV